MQQAIITHPILTEAPFTAVIEQIIAQQMPPEHRPHFEQRLGWLKQIAAQEQNQ